MKALAPEHGVADFIMSPPRIVSVLAAVELYDDTAVETDEVEVVAAKRRLPPDVEAVEAAHQAQPRP